MTPAADDSTTAAIPGDIPSLDRLLNLAAFGALVDRHGRAFVTATLRAVLDEHRVAAKAGTLSLAALAPQAIADALATRLSDSSNPRLRAVFNLTGTVLHTNLGRAVLPEAAVQAVTRALTAPVNLEFDLAAGRRGDRDSLVEGVIGELTGAEAATVVNNNAAALLLLLNTFANRRDVIVSRGELIEIGDSFRLPELMRSAGARLVEVGTTNRTYARDYAGAVTARTALLLQVHTSNYAIHGFTHSASATELAALAREHGLPFAVDLGSGTLVDLTRYGLPKEPTVREAIEAGADLVTFSGDKLLGGPQAGIIAGRADLVRRLKRHPLKRALRVGKLTLAALEAVLALYRAPEFLPERLTTLRLLTRSAAAIETQAQRVLPFVQAALGDAFAVVVAPMASQIGSGAQPVETLASCGLAIRPAQRGARIERVEAALRALPRPVLGRIADRTLWLDLRCLEEHDEAAFCAAWDGLRP
ncbi:L-seryl-tRNA(Sec) selenium transferase [Tahibacter sp. UC22_41]|uniref:L-seryl-tRNA(Sec) selenium transferase n=1 Tax=Tahibacter sp. UC22_41 TaxID=3350178 RepID=UPI0036DDC364